jgi:hypothetical protein
MAMVDILPDGPWAFSLIDFGTTIKRKDYNMWRERQGILPIDNAIWRDNSDLYINAGNIIKLWNPATDVLTPLVACPHCYHGFDVSAKGSIARVRDLDESHSVFEVLEPGSLQAVWAITEPQGIANPRWAPSGDILLVDILSGPGIEARVFDVRTGAFTTLPEAVATRLFSADQPWLSDDEILLADPEGKVLWRYNIHTQEESLFLRVATPYPDEKTIIDYAIDRSGRRLVVATDGTYDLYALDLECLSGLGQ